MSFIFLGSLLVLSSCGGSSGGSEPEKTEPAPIQEEEQNTKESGSQSQVATPVAVTNLTLGDLSYKQNSKGVSVFLRDGNRQLNLLEKQGEASIYKTHESSNYYYYAAGFDGQYVDGLSASWYRLRNIDSTSDFYLTGSLTPTIDLPNRTYIYTGTFIVTRPMEKEIDRMYVTNMVWNLDFASGVLTGHDYPEQAVISFEGTLRGNELEGFVTYPLGRNEFEGGVFGPNAQEIGGGFKNGGVSAVFYGDYNAPLTNLTQ